MFGVGGVGQPVGPDAVAVRVDDAVRNGDGAARQGPRAEAPAADDGTQRASDIQGVPGEGERVGEGAATDQVDGRQPPEDGGAKVAETGTDAHDADVQGKIINK